MVNKATPNKIAANCKPQEKDKNAACFKIEKQTNDKEVNSAGFVHPVNEGVTQKDR